jgi:dTMP kinase
VDLKSKLAGKFIVFDGPDGSGKGVQIKMLAERLDGLEIETVIGRDPGGTEIGDRIRQILLGYNLDQMDVRCETFLFMASRAQLVGQMIEPALTGGKTVLCDRFISATCAYQGAAGYDVGRIIELGRFAVGEIWPQLTLIVDVPVEEGFRRTGRKPHHAGKQRRAQDEGQGMLLADVQPDAMEARPLDFHRKVRQRFLNMPENYPGQVEIIDGMGTPEEVHQRIWEVIERVDF